MSVCACLAVSLMLQGPAPEIDFAHDLGPAVRVLERREDVPPAARERVAALVGCAAEELAAASLFRGSMRRENTDRPCHLVALPLAGKARGGRAVFSVSEGRAHDLTVWGALDFDADPSLRWATFLNQLRASGNRESGAPPEPISLAGEGAAQLEARLRALEQGETDDDRLARALLRQRQSMRRNGMLLGMRRRGERVPAALATEMAGEMNELARLAPDLVPVLGAEPGRHAELAREVAGLYEDWASVLALEPPEPAPELVESTRKSCNECHGATGPDGKTWRDLAPERRRALGLSGTHLWIGLDVAPALGDRDGVSREIAIKVKAGILLVEALGP